MLPGPRHIDMKPRASNHTDEKLESLNSSFLFLRALLGFLDAGNSEPIWHGYTYAVLMFLMSFLQSIVLHQYFRIQNLIGMDIRTVLISAIYRKV